LIRVLIADDHAVLRHGLRLILNEVPDLTVVGEATNGEEAVALALGLAPDVVLMDVDMPDLGGIEATRRIHTAQSGVHILMLTVSSRERDLVAAIKAGARGYILKSAEAEQVVDAIRRIAAGEAILPPTLSARVLDELVSPTPTPGKLTPREIDVLQLVARGLGNKEIAVELSISAHTVKSHVRHILGKLSLRSRTEAAAYAVRAGLSPKD